MDIAAQAAKEVVAQLAKEGAAKAVYDLAMVVGGGAAAGAAFAVFNKRNRDGPDDGRLPKQARVDNRDGNGVVNQDANGVVASASDLTSNAPPRTELTFQDWNKSLHWLLDKEQVILDDFREDEDEVIDVVLQQSPPQVGGGPVNLKQLRGGKNSRLKHADRIVDQLRFRSVHARTRPYYDRNLCVDDFGVKLRREVNVINQIKDPFGGVKGFRMEICLHELFGYRILSKRNDTCYETDGIRFETRWVCELHVIFRGLSVKRGAAYPQARVLGMVMVYQALLMFHGLPLKAVVDGCSFRSTFQKFFGTELSPPTELPW